MNFAPLNKIRHNRFWVFQLLGWLALVVALIFLSLLFNPPTDNFWFALSFVYFANSVIGVILTCGLRYIYRFVWDRGFILRFILAWMGSLVAAYFLWLSQIFLRTLFLDTYEISGGENGFASVFAEVGGSSNEKLKPEVQLLY